MERWKLTEEVRSWQPGSLFGVSCSCPRGTGVFPLATTLPAVTTNDARQSGEGRLLACTVGPTTRQREVAGKASRRYYIIHMCLHVNLLVRFMFTPPKKQDLLGTPGSQTSTFVV